MYKKFLCLVLACMVLLNTTFASVIPGTLIAHYRMNEDTTNKVVADSSGNGRTGASVQNTDQIYRAGKVNGAFDFDGSGDYIEIANHADFNVGTGDISVFAWVNSDDDSSYQNIVSKANWTDDISFRLRGDNKLEIFIDYVNLISAIAVGINAWHFVGFTRKLGTTKLYIDGVERGSSASLTGSIDNVHNVSIGMRGNSSIHPFSGLIDNVMFFSAELTQDDVNILYNAGSGTEIPTELDSKISPRRGNLSNLPLRRRYEW